MYDPPYTPTRSAPPVRAPMLAAIHRRATRMDPTAGDPGDAAVHAHVPQVQPNHPAILGQHWGGPFFGELCGCPHLSRRRMVRSDSRYVTVAANILKRERGENKELSLRRPARVYDCFSLIHGIG